MRGKGTKGFTLIEVAVVVAIVGILSSIAIPQYRVFTYRARQAEAGQLLGGARVAEYVWFGLNDCFPSIRRTPEAGYPPGAVRRPWISVQTMNPNLCDMADFAFADTDFAPATSGGVFHFIECETRPDPPDFTCNALGDIDRDGDIAEFVYCTDHTNIGCLPSSTGEVSLFPFTVLNLQYSVF